MSLTVPVNYDYLISLLRLHLGDIDSTSYRYLDEWLRTALALSIKSLQKRWGYRYMLDDDYNVYRNTSITFNFSEPPIIEQGDEEPIILKASIILKSGMLENSSYSFGSWKDAEISYSNIESSRSRDNSLRRDIEMLDNILKPPQKRLAGTAKRSLPGYKDNRFEYGENEY
jgi:hypothetical protein